MMAHFAASPLLLAATGFCLALQGCGAKAPAGPMPTPEPFAEAILYDGQGNRTGVATLVPEDGHMRGSVEVTRGLTPGAHGMHIHAIGKCTLPDFVSAGGHLNPESKQHGTENPQGPHAGDLPMVTADARGAAKVAFMAHTNMATLLDDDGAALVIHADADDMRTDPTGNSGGRVMCGVFYRKES
ncbi:MULTISPECIES: superoxide dismutase family protein [Sphingobium]|uniref:superoxide dismutase family protein n=1 Tax=Sphingobium TaxID=165695 RepID=UPI0015EC6D6C|nr:MULTISPECIES: superoxide dismutase family protein [Sphingobium]MCW2362008.1 Cu-Zn family superoxide dismutase [Sphingobium sp. B10D3B]MCW2401313.1 Cu-Zn family superoxide dismutase [Sphingobium sp. B10D7B]MCW2408293.1 Cu-Zn family superoxide dismutase [Sphingobium xanthum]